VQPILHRDVQQLTGRLGALIDTFRLYNDRKPELNDSLIALLDLTAATYQERGRTERESATLSMKAEFTTALRGTNPITLEKLTVRRHEMQSAIAFKVLQALESQLRSHLLEATEPLRQAEDLIKQILIAGIQKGLISDAVIHDTTTQEAVEALWRSIASDADIALAQKRVLLLVSSFDVALLIDKLLSALRGS